MATKAFAVNTHLGVNAIAIAAELIGFLGGIAADLVKAIGSSVRPALFHHQRRHDPGWHRPVYRSPAMHLHLGISAFA